MCFCVCTRVCVCAFAWVRVYCGISCLASNILDSTHRPLNRHESKTAARPPVRDLINNCFTAAQQLAKMIDQTMVQGVWSVLCGYQHFFKGRFHLVGVYVYTSSRFFILIRF